jgi:serine-type D-Ala-D-Ala carboxypeptidase/endopeptidase
VRAQSTVASTEGRTYEALLLERICGPLGLRSNPITLTEDMRSRIAQGHNGRLEPPPLWDIPTLAGAAAVRSTANDLAVLLEACLGRRQMPLRTPLARLPETRRPTDVPGQRWALIGLFPMISRFG